MKGLARSALLQLAGFLATGAAVMFFLQRRYALSPPGTLAISVFAGFFLFLCWSFLVAILQPVRERKSLRDGMAGHRPADGQLAGVAGTIDAVGETVRAPLSGRDCVAWEYEIFRTERQGKHLRKVTYFEGTALVPSVISTPAGDFRLLAVPEFDLPQESFEPGPATRDIRRHIAAARIETEQPRGTLKKRWTDDDGAYRREERLPVDLDQVPFAQCVFRERSIRRGERVYAFGLFSEARGGIVPDPNWGRITRVMKGDAASVMQQLSQRIRRYFIGSVLAAGAAAALLWMFLSHMKKI
ncbi:MAG: hypothetical protein ABI592_11510 [Acidobacteriota bacterium]